MPRAVTTDKVSLFYKDWGPRDGTPIVLLHGWPLTGDTFDDLALALAEDGYRSIVPDRRGFGRSDQPWDGYDYDTFASDVDAVLADAGISGPFALAGFSMGGGEVAKLVAEAHSTDQIASLLVISPRTVERHRENILAKLGMRDRVELTRWAIRHGLVEP